MLKRVIRNNEVVIKLKTDGLTIRSVTWWATTWLNTMSHDLMIHQVTWWVVTSPDGLSHDLMTYHMTSWDASKRRNNLYHYNLIRNFLTMYRSGSSKQMVTIPWSEKIQRKPEITLTWLKIKKRKMSNNLQHVQFNIKISLHTEIYLTLLFCTHTKNKTKKNMHACTHTHTTC